MAETIYNVSMTLSTMMVALGAIMFEQKKREEFIANYLNEAHDCGQPQFRNELRRYMRSARRLRKTADAMVLIYNTTPLSGEDAAESAAAISIVSTAIQQISENGAFTQKLYEFYLKGYDEQSDLQLLKLQEKHSQGLST